MHWLWVNLPLGSNMPFFGDCLPQCWDDTSPPVSSWADKDKPHWHPPPRHAPLEISPTKTKHPAVWWLFPYPIATSECRFSILGSSICNDSHSYHPILFRAYRRGSRAVCHEIHFCLAPQKPHRCHALCDTSANGWGPHAFWWLTQPTQ